MDTPNYGKILIDILTDVAGNGHRAEAAARAIHAVLYKEATRACEDAHKNAFPISLLSFGEDFTLGIGNCGMAASFTFHRNGDELTTRGVGIPADVAGIDLDTTWLPGMISAEAALAKAMSIMEHAVRGLARRAKLQAR